MKGLVALGVLAVLVLAGIFSLRSADVMQQSGPQETPTSTPAVNDLPEGWVTSAPNTQGVQFSYPQELRTQYIHAQEWPPKVALVSETFVCEEGEREDENGLQERFTRHEIGGQAYCVAQHAEGAAGSTYTSYEYSTQQGDFVARIAFTLRTVQCLNYDKEEQTRCLNEQASFDLDALVGRVAESIRML